MSVVLVINSGSSSLKYSLMDVEREVPIGEGLIERIGQETAEISHTVRRLVTAGEPAPTVLDTTHRSQRPVRDHDEEIGRAHV